jgi:hypothetical protein
MRRRGGGGGTASAQPGEVVVTDQDQPLREVAVDVASLLDEQGGGRVEAGADGAYGREDTRADARNVGSVTSRLISGRSAQMALSCQARGASTSR